jgi:predicted ATPase/class 3 adenylate cyclase
MSPMGLADQGTARPIDVSSGRARSDLPAGTVTFLFTDIEGSTRLLHELGSERYADALSHHRDVVRAACTPHGGVEVDTQGDAFFVAFPTAPGAIAAAEEIRDALRDGPVRVRMGLHTGTPHVTAEGYVGPDVHRAARIAAAGHGGQVLVSAATAALVGTDGLRDLGEHRLKDLSAPERIHQLGEDEHPRLKTLHQTNLPVPATAFLGREAEVAELSALVSRDGVRLVTLTGPGGTGKTRLALQVVGGLAERYPNGVWWVPLAPLRDPSLVLESAAAAVGASGELAEHIGDKRLLLLLDNFEHLTAAADDLAALLARCPNVSLLVTSREPLHLAGEHEYAVDPLREPDAVQLFLTRALAARRDVTANGEASRICARLDHLPLAIELAAARVKILSPKALLERLDRRLPVLAGGARDLPERQRTLRATIEWSHELLTLDEQRLFARLAVFRGGCTLESAEAVADADLDTLQSLVDKSLIRVRGERVWMLETIREYAVERLEASGEPDDLLRRHAEHFLAIAEEADTAITPHRDDVQIWIDRLKADHDNLRAALDHFIDTGDGRCAQQLAGALWKFWYMTGNIGEGRRSLDAVLPMSTERTSIRARALNGATAMEVESQDAVGARRWAEEALAINRELGDRFGIAHAEFMLANVAAGEEDYAAARPLLETSREEFRALGSEYYTLLSTRVLAWICLELGDTELARTLHEENLRMARAAGNRRIESMTLGALAWNAIDDGRFEDAAPLLRDAHPIRRAEGDRLGTASLLLTVARLLAGTGRPVPAAHALARVTQMYEEMGAAIPAYDVGPREQTITSIRESLDDAEFDAAWQRGRHMTDDEIDALVAGL